MFSNNLMISTKYLHARSVRLMLCRSSGRSADQQVRVSGGDHRWRPHQWFQLHLQLLVCTQSLLHVLRLVCHGRDRVRAHLPASHRHRGSVLREAPSLHHGARCMRVRGRPLCPSAAHRTPVEGLRKAQRHTRHGRHLLVVIVCGVLFSPPEVPRRPVVAVTGENIEGGRRHRGRALLSLLKNQVFLVFAISNFLIFIDLTMLFTLPWNKAIQTGSGMWTTPLVYVISCVVFGYVSDKQWVDRLMLYNTVLIICGVATALIPLIGGKLLVTFPLACGICIGAYETLTSVLLVDLLGIELLPSSLGFLMLFQGAAHVIGQRVSDWLPVLKGVSRFTSSSSARRSPSAAPCCLS
ncbi:uncharacterized protein LOC112555148 [Pomacea canaliculata]|uniref:uncharacterized protein LOC112555148 n=1 Tax=Pomacea canaliculata TaxID=400727 RepID=UPI000D7252CE|nr:uncharacterized protein LOC112555148 [Pomacea canaliculata]